MFANTCHLSNEGGPDGPTEGPADEHTLLQTCLGHVKITYCSLIYLANQAVLRALLFVPNGARVDRAEFDME